ncbi:MAG TPA: hypothetical protein VKZ50_09610 [bacterium]|nr:hypothetical protein [bacterium]
MHVKNDLPDLVNHDGEDFFSWPVHASPDLKAALVILCCLGLVAGAAVVFIRFVGL